MENLILMEFAKNLRSFNEEKSKLEEQYLALNEIEYVQKDNGEDYTYLKKAFRGKAPVNFTRIEDGVYEMEYRGYTFRSSSNPIELSMLIEHKKEELLQKIEEHNALIKAYSSQKNVERMKTLIHDIEFLNDKLHPSMKIHPTKTLSMLYNIIICHE